jgi:hypothetical protein
MKYYDEEQMSEIRKALENEIMNWPGVKSKEMMGCLCYFHGKKFFAWLVTNGIVLPKLTENDRRKLQDQFKTQSFEMGSKATKLRTVILRKPEDLQPIRDYIKKSYNAASEA